MLFAAYYLLCYVIRQRAEPGRLSYRSRRTDGVTRESALCEGGQRADIVAARVRYTVARWRDHHVSRDSGYDAGTIKTVPGDPSANGWRVVGVFCAPFPDHLPDGRRYG